MVYGGENAPRRQQQQQPPPALAPRLFLALATTLKTAAAQVIARDVFFGPNNARRLCCLCVYTRGVSLLKCSRSRRIYASVATMLISSLFASPIRYARTLALLMGCGGVRLSRIAVFVCVFAECMRARRHNHFFPQCHL